MTNNNPHHSPTNPHDNTNNRYEVNPDLVPELEAAGLRFTGRDETGRRMEVLELAPPQDGALRYVRRVACLVGVFVWGEWGKEA